MQPVPAENGLGQPRVSPPHASKLELDSDDGNPPSGEDHDADDDHDDDHDDCARPGSKRKRPVSVSYVAPLACLRPTSA